MVSPVPEGLWSSRIPMSQPTQALEEELRQKMEKVKASWKKFYQWKPSYKSFPQVLGCPAGT